MKRAKRMVTLKQAAAPASGGRFMIFHCHFSLGTSRPKGRLGRSTAFAAKAGRPGKPLEFAFMN
jgi:hypothetical protein